MKEISFLKDNSEKWQQYEALLADPRRADPDTLAELFIQLTDDLSYSKTHYPKSNTTKYLNALAARTHQAIYKNKKERRGRIIHFWRYELPLLFKASHRQLLYSFLIFGVSVFIGVVSQAYDDSFARLIMGDSYVNMTIENINNGDPMAVYKQMHQTDMFVGITFNNVFVSFIIFVFGVFLSMGTVFHLFRNGIMLGCFQYFFYQKGLLFESALVIWIHGALEISAIIIAGCAGLVMGNSIIFPGTYSRAVSFMKGAKQGIKIAIGLVPIFITAGFLEGFVTRYTNMPVWLSLTIILGSLSFIVWYFIIYPILLNRRLNYAKPGEDQSAPGA